MNLVIWGLITSIGVSDAQRHQIPNKLVGFLLLAVITELCLQPDLVLWQHMKGLLITFAIGFLLYLVRAMAGGDVKLLTVIGFWLGAENMLQAVPYIVLAGGVISMFYLALHIACSHQTIGEQLQAYAVQKVTPGWKSPNPLVIPFGPAIVVGLAYYFYIN